MLLKTFLRDIADICNREFCSRTFIFSKKVKKRTENTFSRSLWKVLHPTLTTQITHRWVGSWKITFNAAQSNILVQPVSHKFGTDSFVASTYRREVTDVYQLTFWATTTFFATLLEVEIKKFKNRSEEKIERKTWQRNRYSWHESQFWKTSNLMIGIYFFAIQTQK